MSIDAGAQVAIILLTFGPCVVIVDYWDRFCTLGRAPRTNETLPDFREWCRVTRHPQVFRRLTSCQRTPLFWGVTAHVAKAGSFEIVLYNYNQERFHVKSKRDHRINLHDHKCTCGKTLICEFPCNHIIVACQFLSRPKSGGS